jgi:hypothetical protein
MRLAGQPTLHALYVSRKHVPPQVLTFIEHFVEYIKQPSVSADRRPARRESEITRKYPLVGAR